MLAGVILDHQIWLHDNRERYISKLRNACILCGHLAVIHSQIFRYIAFCQIGSFQHHDHFARLFTNFHNITGFDTVAWNVDALAVDVDMTVIDELT